MAQKPVNRVAPEPIGKSRAKNQTAGHGAGKADEDDFVTSFKGHLLASVAGPLHEKILYYILFLITCVVFIYTSVSLVMSFATDTVTLVEVKYAAELPLPGFWAVVISGTGDAALPPQSALTVLNNTKLPTGACVGAGNGNCAPTVLSKQYFNSVSTPSVCAKCWASGGTGTLPTNDQAIIKGVKDGINSGYGVPLDTMLVSSFNADGSAVSKRSNPTSLVVDMTWNLASWNFNGHAACYIGMYDTAKTFSFLDGQYWVVPLVNSMTMMKISVDKLIDKVKGENTTTYHATTSSVFPYDLSVSANAMNFDTDDKSKFVFEIGSFVTREITIRKKSFAEFYAEIGGCWASALLILAFFFQDKTGGKNGKVKMFRFKGPKGRKALAAIAAKELGTVLMNKASEDLEAHTVIVNA